MNQYIPHSAQESCEREIKWKFCTQGSEARFGHQLNLLGKVNAMYSGCSFSAHLNNRVINN